MLPALLCLLLQQSPEDALKSFTLAKGYRIELVAAEPDVMDPVAMAFDEDGAIFVAEMADYPLGPPSGRIKRIAGGKTTLFVDKVPYPTGVMPWRGGVLVTAAPDIWFFKDADGDGKAEIREVVFSGFTEGNQQHRVNGLCFGLDNWIYGTNGDSGGNVRRGDGPKVSISGRDYRFRPDYSGFEGVAGRGQFSNTFDDRGNRFINDNSNHIRHPVLPLNYLARNPGLAVSSVEDSISDHGGSSVVYPTSKIAERPNDHFAAGRFTSACSITIHLGDAYCCEPVHNLVHRDVLIPKGASFVARRAYENSEFLASTDPWCRPVNLCSGPDGALYVVDMYRAVIEHPQWIPLEMQRRVDLRAGSERGRIYRVREEGAPDVAAPRLSSATPEALAALLDHPLAWWRRTAQRLLIERQDKAALPFLSKPYRTALGRLHALWTREGLGGLDDAALASALEDPDPAVREQALRLAERRPALHEAIRARASEPDPRVRFQLAFSAGELRDPALLASIALKDAEDRWTRVAIVSSSAGISAKVLIELGEALDRGGPGIVELVRLLGESCGASRDEAQVADWLRALTTNAAAQPTRGRLVALSSLAQPLKRWGVGLDALLEKSGSLERVRGWKSGLLDAAMDPAREVADRVGALDLLSLFPLPEMAAALEKLLRPQEPPQVQVAAVKALGIEGAARLLDGWVRYTAPVRREVLSACLSRPATMEGVVLRLEKGEMRAVELEPHQREALLKHPSGSVRERVRAILTPKGSEDRAALIESLFAKIQGLKGDPVAGEKVYLQNCASCHRLNGQGHEVGPNLGSVAGRDKKALLTDILDPNRAVAPQFQVYVVKTPTQDLVSGIIAAETPSSVTLRRANGEESVILRRDLVEIKAWPASLMPDGVENNVTPQNFADLLDFLQRGPAK